MSDRVARFGAAAVALAAWSVFAFAAPRWSAAFFPGALLVVQVMAVLAGPGPGLLLASGVIGVDVARVGLGALEPAEALARAGFVALFAGVFGAVLRGEILRLRERHRVEVEGAKARALRDARDYRLIGSSLPMASRPPRSAAERSQLRQIASIEALHTWSRSLFELVRRAVTADAVRLFSATPDGRLREVREDARDLRPSEPSGALGAVLETQRPVHLIPRGHGPRLGYEPAGPVGAFLAVPLKTGPVVTGVLVAERKEPEPFTEAAEAILAEAAASVAHAVESERIFADMDRTLHEQDQFLDALRLIAEALGFDEVAERLVEATARLVGGDVIAVSGWEPEARRHRIVAVRAGGAAEALRNLELPDDQTNLVSQVRASNTALPYRPLSEQSKPSRHLLGEVDLSLKSVKVFPIRHGTDGLGALIVGSTRDPTPLSRELESMLEWVATQAAVSLANARMYQRMQRMAWLDGLTGLVNHRRFQELLGDAMARADRNGSRVSVVLIDADHFKTVNDTFGHPVGDEVLRRIAAGLQDVVRKTDVVARYGGEEFVLLLESTEAVGAAELAERARRRVEDLAIDGDFGRLRVTVSLGVCTYPDLAPDREQLLARADQALYDAKQRGRNRVRVFSGARLRPAQNVG